MVVYDKKRAWASTVQPFVVPIQSYLGIIFIILFEIIFALSFTDYFKSTKNFQLWPPKSINYIPNLLQETSIQVDAWIISSSRKYIHSLDKIK